MGAVGAIAFVLLLLFAIFFHELGHYLTARWAGVKIRQFFVGFGPTIWSFRRGQPETVVEPGGLVVSAEEAERLQASGQTDVRVVTRPETEYGIKLLPLGGYVRILGFSAFEEVAPEEQHRSFKSIPTYKQAIVLVAGSASHFITAFLLLLLVFSVFGLPNTDKPTTTVGRVMLDVDGTPSPAQAAGLQAGDTVVEIDGRTVRSWDDIRSIVRANPERPMTMKIQSPEGSTRVVEITPAAVTDDGERVGVVGVSPTFELTRVGPLAGAARSARAIAGVTVETVLVAPRAFSPSNLGIGGRDTQSDERAISIYGAGRVAADIAQEGEIALFLAFVAQINIFIAMFNMFPLPPLDGGHLLVAIIERIRRKPVSPRALMPVMAVVFTLLLVLGVSLLVQDIVAPVSPLQ